MIRRKFAALAVALLGALGIVALAPSPAHAAWACNEGNTCFYTGTDGGGSGYQSNAIWPDGTCVTLPASWRNVASSIRNATRTGSSNARFIRYYSATGCGGTRLTVLYSETAWPSLCCGGDNNIESFKVEREN